MILVRGFCSLSSFINGFPLFPASSETPGSRDSIEANTFDSAGKPEELQHPNAPPVKVDLVPLETMLGRRGMSMMIVVPTFAKSE